MPPLVRSRNSISAAWRPGSFAGSHVTGLVTRRGRRTGAFLQGSYAATMGLGSYLSSFGGVFCSLICYLLWDLLFVPGP